MVQKWFAAKLYPDVHDLKLCETGSDMCGARQGKSSAFQTKHLAKPYSIAHNRQHFVSFAVHFLF
jgi:hypothetical protein